MCNIKREIEDKKNNIGALCRFLKSEKNKKYLDFIENNIIDLSNYKLSLSEKLYYYFNDIKSPMLCECNKHLKFIGFRNGYRVTCGNKICYVKKRKESCIEKYGVDNPNKLDSIKNKSKETILKKYNGKHYMYDNLVRAKLNKTMNDRYGFDYAMQSDEIKSKSLKTWLNKTDSEIEDIKEKRNITNSLKTKEELREIENKKNKTRIKKYGSLKNYHSMVQKKIKEKSIENYGVEHFFQSDVIKKKSKQSYMNTITSKILSKVPNGYNYIKRDYNMNKTSFSLDFLHEDCLNNFSINIQLFNKRIDNNEELCLNCNPVNSGVSLLEKEIFNYIIDNYNGVISENDKNIIKVELDIYLPDLNIAFEFNGLYWHSELHKDKNYHLDKTNKCLENDIHLIHIYEDDWLYKKDIVKSRILNLIGKTSNKIYARKCLIKEVSDNKLVRKFLEDNHIQGFVGSKVKLGLFYNDELISLMTFGNLRNNLGQKSKEGNWELLRFCNKLNTSVVGGASKLFKYFTNNYKYESIISYADRSWSKGGLYEKLGFDKISETLPNYFYIDKKNIKRINRFNFRKDKLVSDGFDENKTEHEIMFERGYYRIYDSGSYKYKYKNKIF